MSRSSPIVIGACLIGAALAGGGLGLFVLTGSSYRRARLEAILDEPARFFDSSWILQGAALLLLVLALVGVAMVVFGIRDRR